MKAIIAQRSRTQTFC